MPILESNSYEFISRSPEQTRRVGMRLGAELKTGDIICLEGDLGAGKTTLVQGLASGWGSTDPISSPTYVLVNQYRRIDGERFAHLDAYRLQSAMDADALDLEELIANGPLVVEWAPRIIEVLPAENLNIKMSWVGEEHRQMHFKANGEYYQKLLEDFQKSMLGGN